MPAPRLDIDRAGIAASVALVGQRETSRRTGLSLGTVQRIAKAAGVISPRPFNRVIPSTKVGTPSGTVGTGAVSRPAFTVVNDEIRDLGSKSRLAAAQIGAKVLPAIARMGVGRAIEHVEAANTTGALLQRANVDGWERREQVEHRTGDALTPERVAAVIERASRRIIEIDAEILAVEQKLAAVEPASS